MHISLCPRENNMRRIISLVSCLSLVACQTLPATNTTTRKFEAAPAKSWSSGGMVASANPLATKAGVEILEKGGSAVDAAIAVQTVLTLIEPQSSGIGGGAFMLYYDAKTGDVQSYDGREAAPMGATPDMFMDKATGKPMEFWTAVKSGRSTGAPAVLKMLHLAWSDHGKLGWDQGFQNAKNLATNGYQLTPRTAELLQVLPKMTEPGEGVKKYFYGPDGKPYAAGTLMKNPAFAKTMDDIATQGIDVFYKGYIAQDIVKAVQSKPIPGTLSMEDMANVRVERKEPLCQTYRVHLICGMGMPSSGGIGELMIMGIVENFDMPKMGNGIEGIHHYIEAQRLGYIDRDTYVADDKFVAVPVKGLLDKKYLKSRADLISDSSSFDTVSPGTPEGAQKRGKDATGKEHGTSHFVIVDKEGNVVSMTTSVENLFGAQTMVDGFFINNQLTDFSMLPVDSDGVPIVNAVAPGKKPRSSMSPTIVFDKDGQFELGIGSPGGNAIIAYVTKALIGILDWNMPLQDALDQPNIIARSTPVSMEFSRMDKAKLDGLTALGHKFTGGGGAENSGLHAIMFKDGKLIGAADSRREGNAVAVH